MEVFCPSIRINVTCRILENSHAFRFKQTPYHDKMAFFFVPCALTVEINIPCDALLTGYFVFESYLSHACASTKIFPTRYIVALALWASI